MEKVCQGVVVEVLTPADAPKGVRAKALALDKVKARDAKDKV